jgi:polygalacturonase
LYLSPGAILKAVDPIEGDPFIIEKDWAEKKNYNDFIFANDRKNIKICGKGIIDTSGLDWHARRSIVFSDCSNISVSGITLNGAAHWTMPFFGCTEVSVNNVKIIGYRENSDGINLVDCKHVSVKDCFIRTGDDAVCVKSMGLNKRLGCRHNFVCKHLSFIY